MTVDIVHLRGFLFSVVKTSVLTAYTVKNDVILT